MKKLTIGMLLMTTLLLNFFITNAQVKTRIFDRQIPDHLMPGKSVVIPEFFVRAPISFDSVINGLINGLDKKNTEYRYSFALPVNVNIDLLKNAKIIEGPDSVFYYLKIKAEKAKNLSLHFGRFNLSPNAIQTLYTNKELTDSIIDNQNNPYNFWATRVYQG